MAGLMAQSVVAKHSMVAMLGWIMPLPLEMPPHLYGFAANLHFRRRLFGEGVGWS